MIGMMELLVAVRAVDAEPSRSRKERGSFDQIAVHPPVPAIGLN